MIIAIIIIIIIVIMIIITITFIASIIIDWIVNLTDYTITDTKW